MRIVLMIVLTY